ncbi:MAG: hypothetical protein AAGE96_15880 [Cyanobacteria bacterium P01_G01_bin.19]
MTDALAKLCGCVYQQARTREEIDKELCFFPYQLSEEAYEFYQWDGAPVDKCSHRIWKDRHNHKTTYKCVLEKLLGTTYDFVHFLSIEEAKKLYTDDYNYFPFVEYAEESGILAIAKLEKKVINNSPVVRLTEEGERSWFPDLTSMIMAIAEAKEKIGTLHPQTNYDDEDWETEEYEEKIGNDWKTIKEIALKYGSPRGSII